MSYARLKGMVVEPLQIDLRPKRSRWSRFKGWLAWKLLVDEVDVTLSAEKISITINGVERAQQVSPEQADLLRMMKL